MDESPQEQPQTAAPPPAIEVNGLECGYHGKVLLRDVTFTVGRGEIFFIIGGSGCGKSTLLRHLVGLNAPTAGTVSYFGHDFHSRELSSRQEVLKTFGVLFQSGALWSSLTLRENVSLPLELHTPFSRHEIEEVATLKLAQVGLAPYADYYPAEISGGMRKRAGLARALALDPAIVFFDEPSAGLDPITSRKLDELIRQVREMFGTTIVIVSHELASIFDLADRVVMLDREAGGIIATGAPRELAAASTDARVQEFLRRGDLAAATIAAPEPTGRKLDHA
jgi:phospholipid/cholesterol/gamma-HCH transport system ATP-binding protein